jgi:N-acetylneuraminic acid mutarotase
MFRSPPVQLMFALGSLALIACAEDQTPTQPESGAEAAPAVTLAAALAPNTWTLKAAPPNWSFANGLSAGVVPDASGQSIAYTLGGRDDDGGCGAVVLTYKIGTNTWASKGFEPQVDVFNSNGVGKIGNTLYISGGESYCGGSWFIDGGFWAYDPATNTLTRKPTPPKLTADGVTGVIDGKLYVLPGLCSSDHYGEFPAYCETQPFRRLFRYNPATNRWATKQSAPHFHTNGAGGVINGKFYVAGGEGEAALDRYDPATDTWKTLAPLPVAGTARGAVLQGKLYVVVETTTARRAYAYDPATNKWTAKTAPRWYHDAIVPITWAGRPFLLALGGIHFNPSYQPNPTEVYAP